MGKDKPTEKDQAHSGAVARRCTSLNLRKASRAASQFLESYLQPVGLHASQFGILSHLSRAGSATMTHLAEEMFLDRTTLTRNLQVLQRESLVIVAQGADKRIREVALTDKGRSVLGEAIPLWEQAEDALAQRLGDKNRKALLITLAALMSLEQK